MNPQTYTAPQEQQEAPASFAAILPLLLFLLIFIGTGVSLSLAGVDMAFYQLSATVAILPAIALALMQGRARLSKKITIFLTGVGEINIITMCMIYLLAGGFAATATAIGSVDATVNFGLSLVPPAFILPGLFLIGAFVSTAMGTSMGTVAAITPIALGVAAQTSIEVPVLMGVVLGGAMFGDNLSFISDTTIAACNGQGCPMRDKFRVNFAIALPAALVSLLLILVLSFGQSTGPLVLAPYSLIQMVPYLLVLVGGILGANVFLVLLLGIGSGAVIMLATGATAPTELLANMGSGAAGMYETAMVAILVSALCALIRAHGGFDALLNGIRRVFHGKKGGQLGMGLLVGTMDIATANNTVAIVMANPIAKEMSQDYGISPRKTASLLDTFSCIFQGILPYGAQMLVALSAASELGHELSAFQVIPNLFYPFLLLISSLLFIFVLPPRKGDTL